MRFSLVNVGRNFKQRAGWFFIAVADFLHSRLGGLGWKWALEGMEGEAMLQSVAEHLRSKGINAMTEAEFEAFSGKRIGEGVRTVSAPTDAGVGGMLN